MKMKKILALVMALVLVLSLAACQNSSGSTTGGDSEKKSIGICIYKFDDNFMTTYRKNLEDSLKAKGYDVTIVDGNNDQAKQTEQINTFISQGVDALIINPVMTTAADAIVNQVKAAGIPTVFINREPTAEIMQLWDKIAYVGCDAAQDAPLLGEAEAIEVIERPGGFRPLVARNSVPEGDLPVRYPNPPGGQAAKGGPLLRLSIPAPAVIYIDAIQRTYPNCRRFYCGRSGQVRGHAPVGLADAQKLPSAELYVSHGLRGLQPLGLPLFPGHPAPQPEERSSKAHHADRRW